MQKGGSQIVFVFMMCLVFLSSIIQYHHHHYDCSEGATHFSTLCVYHFLPEKSVLEFSKEHAGHQHNEESDDCKSLLGSEYREQPSEHLDTKIFVYDIWNCLNGFKLVADCTTQSVDLFVCPRIGIIARGYFQAVQLRGPPCFSHC